VEGMVAEKPSGAALRDAAEASASERVKVPSVLQMEAVECGAAALAMVLEHYGRVVPLEELRLQCGVSRDGSKASNVLRAARENGLVAKGFRVELEDIRRVKVPCIVYWNFNHFLVLEGWDEHWYYINDPAEGSRKVSCEEFDEGFTGVVLNFAVGEDFKPEGERPSTLVSLWSRLKGSPDAVRLALVTGLLILVTGLVIPTFAKVFVDRILVAGLDNWYRPLLVAMGMTAVLRAGVTWLQQRYLLRLQMKLAIVTSARFIWHLLRLPAEFYSQRYSGEVSTRVQMNDTIATFIGKQLAGAAIDVLVVVFFALIMFSYDWLLTTVAVSAVVAVGWTTRAVNEYRKEGSRRVIHEESKAQGALIGGLNTIETLKASGSEADLFQRWSGLLAKSTNAKQKLELATQLFLVVPPLLTTVANASVLGLGAVRVMDGALTIGELVAFQSLMSSFLLPVNNLVAIAGKVQTMDGNMARIDDVLRYPPDPIVVRTEKEQERQGEEGIGRPEGGDGSGKLRGHLELKGITFGYSRLGKPLIENLNLNLTSGRRVALVGPSGCGKSTITKLVSGLYETWDGEILFDGQRREAYPRSVLAASIAMVDQEISLFEGTVRENLTMWDPHVPDPVLIQAAVDACIHDDIMPRRGGYDSMVDEGGSNFSGGQRQRLEIARALLLNPRIIILDEATSALDTVTEEKIDEALRRRGCTAIIIAHRLSTVRDADEILVLERGKVVQRGTHETLIADADGLYAHLAQETS
jgi:ATP-binding cassette, subfamily C, bacterial